MQKTKMKAVSKKQMKSLQGGADANSKWPIPKFHIKPKG